MEPLYLFAAANRPYNGGGFEAADWFDIILAGKHKQWNGEDMAKVVSGKIGDTVVESGNYICQNCGHYQYFEANDNFEDCQSCYEPDITWELE